MARSMARNITQDVAASLAADRAEALALLPVSREIGERLDRFVALLLERQAVMNLVAPSTLPQIWTRHVADSLQLLSLAPRAKRWIDLGSGAGFPGGRGPQFGAVRHLSRKRGPRITVAAKCLVGS